LQRRKKKGRKKKERSPPFGGGSSSAPLNRGERLSLLSGERGKEATEIPFKSPERKKAAHFGEGEEKGEKKARFTALSRGGVRKKREKKGGAFRSEYATLSGKKKPPRGQEGKKKRKKRRSTPGDSLHVGSEGRKNGILPIILCEEKKRRGGRRLPEASKKLALKQLRGKREKNPFSL